MKITVKFPQDIQGLYAFQSFQALVLGLTMLPAYAGRDQREFLAAVDAMTDDDKRAILREAANHVRLDAEDIHALVGICLDANGVPYGPTQLAALGPLDIRHLIVEAALACSKVKPRLVTEAEKKN